MITKKTIFIFSLLACSLFSYAQQMPSMKIDNDTTYFSSDISFPYWLKSGQSLQSLQNVKNVSIIEFDVDSNGNMKFSRIVSGNLNTPSTVPVGKVWKMEAIGLTSSYNSSAITNNIGQVSHGFSSSAIPSIFTSPKTFNTPGTYQWIVPPDITKICIEVWGGGGNGGSSNMLYSSGVWVYLEGGGGGGGAYGYECFDVIPNTVFNVIVGGGTQTSSFGNLISASGGLNGQNCYAYSSTNLVSGVPGSGGNSNAYFHISGERGGQGATYIGGKGANGGSGGLCNGDAYGCVGSNGSSPGGGGGGGKFAAAYANTSLIGGVGAPGQVIIYW